VAASDAPTEGSALADEVFLADELAQISRPHPGGQRLALGRWLEEGFGAGAAGLRPWCGHGSMVRATGFAERNGPRA
jgi:hypothetical protein